MFLMLNLKIQLQTSAKRAQAIRMHNEATVRLKELRQIVQSEVIGSGQGTDEIIQLQVRMENAVS